MGPVERELRINADDCSRPGAAGDALFGAYGTHDAKRVVHGATLSLGVGSPVGYEVYKADIWSEAIEAAEALGL